MQVPQIGLMFVKELQFKVRPTSRFTVLGYRTSLELGPRASKLQVGSRTKLQ